VVGRKRAKATLIEDSDFYQLPCFEAKSEKKKPVHTSTGDSDILQV
jgi:hypothetical protein